MATIGKTNLHSRTLRRNSTDAERRLWYWLRDRRLGGFKFRRQVTIGPFIADFACVECKLVVEADGGQHGSERDGQRSAYLKALGWRTLRFWNNDVLQHTDAVLETILTACEQRKGTRPSPCPLPQAGEGT